MGGMDCTCLHFLHLRGGLQHGQLLLLAQPQPQGREWLQAVQLQAVVAARVVVIIVCEIKSQRVKQSKKKSSSWKSGVPFRGLLSLLPAALTKVEEEGAFCSARRQPLL